MAKAHCDTFPNLLRHLTPECALERLFCGVWCFVGKRGDISVVCAFIFTGSGSSAVVSSTRTRDCYPSRALLHTPSLTLLASRFFFFIRANSTISMLERADTGLTNIIPIIHSAFLGGGGARKFGKRIRLLLRFGHVEAPKRLRMSLFSHGLTSYHIPGRTRLRIDVPFP